jgi:LPXTG-motif cell wall-anchored protein
MNNTDLAVFAAAVLIAGTSLFYFRKRKQYLQEFCDDEQDDGAGIGVVKTNALLLRLTNEQVLEIFIFVSLFFSFLQVFEVDEFS